jgi:hypothetical protein
VPVDVFVAENVDRPPGRMPRAPAVEERVSRRSPNCRMDLTIRLAFMRGQTPINAMTVARCRGGRGWRLAAAPHPVRSSSLSSGSRLATHGGFLGGEYGYAGEPDAFAAKLCEVLAAKVWGSRRSLILCRRWRRLR